MRLETHGTRVRLHCDPIKAKNTESVFHQSEIGWQWQVPLSDEIKGDSLPFPPNFKSFGEFSRNTKNTVF